MKWETFLAEEREAFIHFEDISQRIIVFVRDNVTGNKLKKKIGDPERIETHNNKICSMQWEIPYSERDKIRKALSINNYISTYKSSKNIEAQEESK